MKHLGVTLPLTSEQIRGARAMLRMEQTRLAELASVKVETIKRLEDSLGPVPAHATTIIAIRRVLENAGVVFIEENGDGPGLRLRKRTAKKLE
jgi:DNA-binding XRE family transcriptional regulator